MTNLENLPDVEFAQKDINSILDDMINGFQNAYYNQTGKHIVLQPGDKIRIFLYSQALREFQLRILIDSAAKQNLLKYASGDYLDNIGAPFVERLQPQSATVTEKFTLSAAQETIQIIPKGTRVSSSNGIYFITLKDVEIPVGATDIQIIMQCITTGTIGNEFIPGQINILVDPLPWIANVTNIDTSQGGSDIEDDDSFRDRIQKAPEGYSTAGPKNAYIYFAKKYNQSIADVKVSSPNPGEVSMRILLKNGEIPDATFLQGLSNYLSADTIRPLTDKVTVNAPYVINYDISLTYYILTDDSTSITSIQNNVNQAVQDYILWQKNKIGRDINPSKLISMVMAAGAKRVEITNPVRTAINDTQVAIASTNIAVTYGGLEDD